MKSIFPLFLVMGLIAASVSGCSGDSSSSPTSPTVPTTSTATSNLPFSTVDLRVGTGAEATTGRPVTVNYSGWLYNAAGTDNKGTLFDSSLAAGRTPLAFTVGASNIIPGFSQCVLGMKVGGLRRCVIPPSRTSGGRLTALRRPIRSSAPMARSR